MRTLAYWLMPHHWHLVLWPERDGQLSAFMTNWFLTPFSGKIGQQGAPELRLGLSLGLVSGGDRGDSLFEAVRLDAQLLLAADQLLLGLPEAHPGGELLIRECLARGDRLVHERSRTPGEDRAGGTLPAVAV